MSRTEQVIEDIACDVCGKPVEEDDDHTARHTMTIGVDTRPGVYALDLCPADLVKLNKAVATLDHFLTNATKVASHNGKHNRRSRRPKVQPPIREWARNRGFAIGDRGRVPQAIQDAYAEAAQAG